MTKIDISISKNSKAKMLKIKEKYNLSLTVQIKKILDYYNNLPIEKLANIVIDEIENYVQPKDTSTITINVESIKNEISHLRAFQTAINTKIMNLTFKNLLHFLIDRQLEKQFTLFDQSIYPANKNLQNEGK
ncbi:hypothetical protein MXL46_13990 [Heyndrickxia sporothermodurans]|uniref:hypothetical protein n=1 Tax=Heyndrickxia sporothermodurans TaxID=46224 RepID=UPI002DBA84E1|nr:hypothetical protein [Heyndrickxia sporothermodurans]MEB6550202.1 hypothetical protein [Heyndrickxia sporothermodurans]